MKFSITDFFNKCDQIHSAVFYGFFKNVFFREREGGALFFFTFNIIISEIESETPQVKDIQHFQLQY